MFAKLTRPSGRAYWSMLVEKARLNWAELAVTGMIRWLLLVARGWSPAVTRACRTESASL